MHGGLLRAGEPGVELGEGGGGELRAGEGGAGVLGGLGGGEGAGGGDCGGGEGVVSGLVVGGRFGVEGGGYRLVLRWGVERPWLSGGSGGLGG